VGFQGPVPFPRCRGNAPERPGTGPAGAILSRSPTEGLDFDPADGDSLPDLLALVPHREPPGFPAFSSARFRDTLGIDPCPSLERGGLVNARFRVANLAYRSSDEIVIRGWLLQPVALRCYRLLACDRRLHGADARSRRRG